MPYGSASSVKCVRLRASLSTVSWLEMPASSVRKYRTPPATLILESASAGAAVASSAPAAPAAMRRDLPLTKRQTLARAQTFGPPGVCEAGPSEQARVGRLRGDVVHLGRALPVHPRRGRRRRPAVHGRVGARGARRRGAARARPTGGIAALAGRPRPLAGRLLALLGSDPGP